MKTIRRLSVCLVLTRWCIGLVAGGLSFGLLSASAQPHYKLTILAVHGTCVSMNNGGQIVGFRLIAPTEKPTPYIFGGGVEHDISNLYCYPIQINDVGQFIANGLGTSNQLIPLVRDANGKVVKLPYLGGTTQYTLWAINSSGTVVGRDYNSDGSVSLGFVYQNNKISALPVIQGHTFVSAHCINTAGQIVAQYRYNNDPNQRRAAIITGTQMQDLGTYSGGTDIQPFAMNDNDEVVGIGSEVIQNGIVVPSAFLYSGGQIQPVGPWVPTGINNSSQAVGYKFAGSGITTNIAVLYAGGKLTDLNTLIEPLDSNVHIYSPLAINDSGEILALCWVSNDVHKEHSCVLTPQ